MADGIIQSPECRQPVDASRPANTPFETAHDGGSVQGETLIVITVGHVHFEVRISGIPVDPVPYL